LITIAERTRENIEATLGGFLHTPHGGAGFVGAVASEYLRAMIFGTRLSGEDPNEAGTIHVTRLLTSARRAIDLVWPARYGGSVPTQADICSAMLERLGTLGDAHHLGQGQWMATPLRIVMADNSPSCLLIGTAPMPAVRKHLGTEPACAGAARFVGERVLDKPGNRDIALTLDAWLGRDLPLMEWTALVLDTHESMMAATQGVATEQLEIYAPDVLRSQRRSGRWIPAGEVNRALDGVRLCQPQMRFARSYDVPQYLAHFEFKNGALALRRSAPIRRDLTLRLRFGLDVMLKAPRNVSLVHTGATFRIDRPLSLPEPEQRIYSLGWDEPAPEAPKRLAFYRDALPILMQALSRLSIVPPRGLE
jgi:hypothetical protein